MADKQKVAVIIFRVVNDKHEYLLLKKRESKGGFWQPVTGRVEKGEELLDAVKREVEEETGVSNIKRIIKDVYDFILKEEVEIKEYVFGAEIKNNAEITFDKNSDEEHDDHKWCSYKEAMSLLKWRGNKTGLTNLNKILVKE